MSSVSMSRISSISTSIASVGGSNSFCSSSYSHISTASRFRIRLIWCDPYLAVRNFSRRSFTSPFSVKLTLSPVRPGDRSQSFMVSTPHCIPSPFSSPQPPTIAFDLLRPSSVKVRFLQLVGGESLLVSDRPNVSFNQCGNLITPRKTDTIGIVSRRFKSNMNARCRCLYFTHSQNTETPKTRANNRNLQNREKTYSELLAWVGLALFLLSNRRSWVLIKNFSNFLFFTLFS